MASMKDRTPTLKNGKKGKPAFPHQVAAGVQHRGPGGAAGLQRGDHRASCRGWSRTAVRRRVPRCWLDFPEDVPLPVIEGTIGRLEVDHLPGDRDPKPVWLWTSAIGATPEDVDRWWRCHLRRFDLEHTFRLWKQTLVRHEALCLSGGDERAPPPDRHSGLVKLAAA